MQCTSPIYSCRLCGATSYRRLTHRGPDGAMQYSGAYRCSGCSMTFTDTSEWREAEGPAVERTPQGAARKRPYAGMLSGHDRKV